jgi:hypothetical protein
MRKFLSLVLVVILSQALAQSVQGSVGSPLGVNAGVRFALVPLLVDGRIYGGYNPVNQALGGGADVLVSVPLTDLYAGGGAFYTTKTPLALGAETLEGSFGLRAVLGTYLNVGIPLLGFFVEIHPMYLVGNQSVAVGGAFGVNVGF